MENQQSGERAEHRRVRPCGETEWARGWWNRKQKTRAHRDPETGDEKAERQRSGTESGVRLSGSEAKAAPATDRNRRRREERKSRGKRCPVHSGQPPCGYGGR